MAFIIILNWNGFEDTVQCIESCRELTYSNFRILVVDNGSTDNSEKIIRERFRDIPLIQTGKNLGFAGGNNVGIRYAMEKGADYIWLLNNDTVVDAQCLGFLVRAAEAEPSAGMVGSKICYYQTPEIIWYAGGGVDMDKGGFTYHTGKDLSDNGSYDIPGPTGYITGCSLLVKKETVRDIGLLDENYFVYFEDVEWSMRAREHGWKLLYEPKAKLLHKEGARPKRVYSDKFIYYSIRNRLSLMKSFAPRRMWRCHLLHLKTMLFFMKTALGRGLFASLRPFKLAVMSYADFYLYKKTGMREDV